MFDALKPGRDIVVIPQQDFRGRYSYDQLGKEAAERNIKFAPRPVLSGKPREEMNTPRRARQIMRDGQSRGCQPDLDGMVAVAKKGERIVLLCACADTCTCHRTRWLGESLSRRGVMWTYRAGKFDYERYIEEGRKSFTLSHPG